MHHIHESPQSMAVPLIILAALSFAGGFMNIPEVLFGNSWLHEYLSPVFASSSQVLTQQPIDHSTEYLLMAVVVGLTAIVIGIAYSFYVKKQHVPVEDSKLAGLTKTLYHKYYVDEIYDALIVRPVHWFGKIGDTVIESLAIDRVVNSFGSLTRGSSQILSRLQTGSIGFYIFMMVLSIIVILTLATVGNFGR
jgi:NADH-quinone oxidoreductase subunit L